MLRPSEIHSRMRSFSPGMYSCRLLFRVFRAHSTGSTCPSLHQSAQQIFLLLPVFIPTFYSHPSSTRFLCLPITETSHGNILTAQSWGSMRCPANRYKIIDLPCRQPCAPHPRTSNCPQYLHTLAHSGWCFFFSLSSATDVTNSITLANDGNL